MITRIYKQNLHRLENRKSYSLIGHFVCSSAVEFMTEVASFTKVASIAENSASKPTSARIQHAFGTYFRKVHRAITRGP